MMRVLLVFAAISILTAQNPPRILPGQLAPATTPPRQQPGQVAPPSDASPEVVDSSAGQPIHVTTTVVVVPTTVLDRHGDYIDGLQPQDFTLYDNGKPQKITADIAYQPISLVLAVQASYSLNDILPKVQKIGNEVNDLVVGSGGEMALIAFDHRIQHMQDFTDDGAKISEALRRLTPGSSSHRMIDSVIESVRMLQHRPTDRRRIILLISEKRDGASENHLRDALTAAEFGNIAIYSIDISHLLTLATGQAMPPRPDPIPPTAQHLPGGAAQTPTTFDQLHNTGNFIPMFVEIFKNTKSLFVADPGDVLTRYTGGKQYSFVSQKSLERAVSALGQEIHHQYLLSYSPNNLSEGGFHDIRVEVNRPQLEVRTRPGYWKAPEPGGQ
jgi:VWFA-related protein